MLCSQVYYFFIILPILYSKVVSSIYDKATYVSIEDKFIKKGENSEYFTTANAVTTTEQEEDDVSDSEAGVYIFKTPVSDIIYGKIKYSALKAICPRYKNGQEVELDKMADVWQMVYYHLKEDLPCFKIYIKKTNDEEKKAYESKYGTFSSKVDWSACDLEIMSNDKSETQRRHFLQRSRNGIMDNIIILEEIHHYNSTYTLHPENPDQWLVVKNLLLMRDCYDGDVVVFSRVPHVPRRKDVMEALVYFGEYTMEGKMGCKK
ncbi:hypothetical protein ABMA28_001361 [Loxostege sticticalis]|uniref:Uncharacterized protein n=1 Tax=Loxostege sticticalis TaxID=481309 RepID=A0ABD0T1D9_LOXSC